MAVLSTPSRRCISLKMEGSEATLSAHRTRGQYDYVRAGNAIFVKPRRACSPQNLLLIITWKARSANVAISIFVCGDCVFAARTDSRCLNSPHLLIGRCFIAPAIIAIYNQWTDAQIGVQGLQAFVFRCLETLKTRSRPHGFVYVTSTWRCKRVIR